MVVATVPLTVPRRSLGGCRRRRRRRAILPVARTHVSDSLLIMVKWLQNKILVQRIFLLSITGMIAHEILVGYLDYNNQVVEYMESMSYQQARESSRMKSRGLSLLDGVKSSARNQHAANTETE
ncbi:uncharacterized protein LOC105830794 [Monomorium pharaonis]|uniref:uncharacterized protein LOC105830794 n=1 Tax=Monomorium pharaonis TaxID=307658 RepID=UPI00063ED5BB|nr:uncharacterized protein LOC105830794 [Monomorium pharaonis]